MVHCVNTKNGITGGPVCQGDITVELTSGGVINSSTGVGLQANNASNAGGTVALEGKQGMKVSWQVTGIRKDAWAQANPLNVEADKTAGEQDYYRHPEAHNQSTERGIGWVQHPEIMRRLTEK